MKRLHLHVTVPDLPRSIAFYETLFGSPPSVTKADYAKWMLEDPRVNFAISTRDRALGLNHAGIQVESPGELAALSDRLKAAGETTFDEKASTCCYAKSDKSWVADPAGLRWETFFTFGEATTYGESTPLAELETSQPQAQAKPTACCGAMPSADQA